MELAIKLAIELALELAMERMMERMMQLVMEWLMELREDCFLCRMQVFYFMDVDKNGIPKKTGRGRLLL